MEILTEEMLNKSIGQLMDETRENMIREDERYQDNERILADLEKKYVGLKLEPGTRRAINAYITGIQMIDGRYADISYMAGFEDAVKMLKILDLVKANI